MVVLWPLHHWIIHRKLTATASPSLLSLILLNILLYADNRSLQLCTYNSCMGHSTVHSGNTKQLLEGRKCSFYGLLVAWLATWYALVYSTLLHTFPACVCAVEHTCIGPCHKYHNYKIKNIPNPGKVSASTCTD